jgi:hypothetical protein
MREMKNEHAILVGRPKGKRPLGKLRRRWEINFIILLYLRDEAWENEEWIHLNDDRSYWLSLVNNVMTLRDP